MMPFSELGDKDIHEVVKTTNAAQAGQGRGRGQKDEIPHIVPSKTASTIGKN
jgi:hypothetical protein